MKCEHYETCVPRQVNNLKGCVYHLCDDSVPLRSPLSFHEWLEAQPLWVRVLCQNDQVYQAMTLAYKAGNKETTK